MSVQDEKKFIHDIITPLTVAEYQVDKLIKQIKTESFDLNKALEMLEKAEKNHKKLWGLIQERRSLLKISESGEPIS